MSWRRCGLLHVAVSVLAGCCAVLIIDVKPALGWHYLMALSLMIGLVSLFICSPRVKLAVSPVCAALVAFSWAELDIQSYETCRLTESEAGGEFIISGRVLDAVSTDASAVRFEFDVEDIQPKMPQDKCGNLHLRLSWYRRQGELSDIQPGQHWHLLVRLKPPHGLANPGGFDYERWLFTRDIHATGYVRRSADNRILAQNVDLLSTLRGAIRELIAGAVDTRQSAMLTALAIGDRRGIAVDDWRLLIDTGTNHLLAISGLHIGLAAAFAAGTVLLAGRRLLPASMLLRTPLQDIAWITGMLAALAYALLSGMGVPAQRALIMLCVFFIARLLRRHSPASMSLAVAMLIVLCIEPRSVHLAGFWFSFAAVSIIFVCLGNAWVSRSRWLRLILIQLALSIGLMPLGLLMFQQASLVAPLANLVMVPAISLLVVPLVLSAIVLMYLPWISAALLSLAGMLLNLLWQFLGWLGGFDQVVLTTAMLYAVLPFEPDLAHGELAIDILDVGQGTAVVLRTHQHTVVYDSGPALGRYDAARMVIIPFLRGRGIDEIDTLIISHGDNDHIGGASSLIEDLTVHALTGQQTAQLQHHDSRQCHAGERWEYDGVSFEMLYPALHQRALSDNDMSCVLKVSTEGGSILLTGDIERRGERTLLQMHDHESLQADILLVPHHGSTTSSDSRFIERVSADQAIITAGYRNRYRLPAASVVQRYTDAGSRVTISGHTGTISFRITEQGVSGPELYREENPAPWRRRVIRWL